MFASYLHAQSNITPPNSYVFWNAEMQAIAKPESKPGWIYFKDDFNTPVQDIFTTHAAAFGLGVDDEMVLTETKIDNLGYMHYIFNQKHKSTLVKNGKMVVHEGRDSILYATGKIYNDLNLIDVPSVTANSALDVSRNAFVSYLQNLNVDTTNIINKLTEFKYVPISDNNVEEFYTTIFNKVIDDEIISVEYYNNVSNGSVNFYIELHKNDNLNHSYHDDNTYFITRNFDYDNVDVFPHTLPIGGGNTSTTNYDRLMFSDLSRGNGIENYYFTCTGPTTVNCNTELGFYQIDNNNVLNNNGTNVVGMKHGANVFANTQLIYDYLLNQHSMNSIDNYGEKLNTLTNAHNKIYPSSVSRFHDSRYYVSTTLPDHVKAGIGCGFIDGIGHEWGHAIVKHGVDFSYLPNNLEAKALEEGFCDIFGHLVQDYANENNILDINDPNWLLCDGSFTTGENRSMKNPTSFQSTFVTNNGTTQYPSYFNTAHPDYYNGTLWLDNTSGLSEDVIKYVNSTVFSHWFYLASNGGLKTNEIGDTYNLQGIGIDNLGEIVVRVIANSLVPQTATFLDMRRATIQTTFDEYGFSCQLLDVENAWDAVGVYDNSPPLSYSQSFTIINNFKIENGVIENWNNPFYLITDDIVVENGGVLNINNTIVLFMENIGITIKPGGILNVNSSSLYNYGLFDNQSCNGFWKGIQVEGDPKLWNCNSTLPQNCNATIAGQVRITNNSTIENAHIGIASYTEDQIWNGQTVKFQGGSIYAENSTFRNCNESIVFGWGEYEEDDIYIATNSQKIDGCIFECTGPLIDPIYNNEASKVFITKKDIWGWDQLDNLSVINSTFRNTGNFQQTKKGAGIVGDLGQCFKTIEGNNFENLSIGIDINTPTFSHNVFSVIDNTFNNVEKGLRAIGGTPNFSENKFLNIPPSINTIINNQVIADDTYGIFYLGNWLSTKTASIENNSFSGTTSPTQNIYNNSYGIVIEDVWNEDEPIYLYNNNFEGVDIGIQSQMNNMGLKIKCNQFVADENGNLGTPLGIAGITVFDQQANMGENCNGNSSFQAGNEWLDVCNGNTQNDIALDLAASSFEYWAHNYVTGGSSSASTTQPLCSNQSLYTLTVCDGITINPGLNQPYPNKIKDAAACGGAFTGWLKPTNGTWSDFLVTLINDRDVHVGKLINLQAQLIDIDTQKELIASIKNELAIINEYDGKIASALKEIGDENAYKQFLENLATTEAKMKLVDAYLKEGKYSEAQSLLNQIEYLTKPDYVYEKEENKIRQKLNQEAISKINELQINLNESNRNWLELNEAELFDLNLIKEGLTPAAKTAEQILSFYGVVPNPHPIKKFTPEYLAGLKENINTFNYQLQIAPNPANLFTQVSYILPEWTKDAQIKITDQYYQMGTELFVSEIDIESNQISINTSNLSNGVYIVNLKVNGEVVDGEQLLILH